MTRLRVVLDTNTFHGTAFDQLESSPFLRLCRAGRVTPIYSHIFIEESMRAYAIEGKRDDLVNRWLPMVIQSAEAVCDDFVHLWREELVQGKGRKAWPFMRAARYGTFKRGVENIPADGSWRAFKETEEERAIEDQKRGTQRKNFLGMREDIAAWSKANPGAFKAAMKDFNPAHLPPDEVEGFGWLTIDGSLPCWNPKEVFSRWARSKDNYPFFTQFAKNMVYASRHAMSKHGQKIDLNAQADMDLLTHLLHADVVVSNETGFLKTAFDDLWKPRGKVLMTTPQFVAHLARL